jgi:dihydrofolate synthase / folylpolyglutamate synthase
MNDARVLALYARLERDLSDLIGPPHAGRDLGLKLERVIFLLDLLNNPQDRFASIHVGGTSGKGSTATMISAILTGAGLHTGLHLSPYLQILNEGFQIDDRVAPTTLLARIWDEIKPAVDRAARESPWGAPSYFEALVAMVFVLFAQQKVDAAVVEVGLGGSLDATNVLHSRVAVLTSIGLDHTEILGDTVELIAQDKAGIIKPGQQVISGALIESAQSIIAARCAAQGATLWQLGRDFHVRATGDCTFRVDLPGRSYGDLRLAMRGDFQLANAACAVAAAHAFTGGLPDDIVRQGLRRAFIPGRVEEVQQNPTVVLDGAHNEDKMRAAAAAMDKHYGGRPRMVVLAVKSDKAYRDMLPYVLAGASQLIVTAFGAKGGRGPVDPQALAQAAAQLAPDLPITVVLPARKAVDQALAAAGAGGLVWITGSLYLLGEVRQRWYPWRKLILEAQRSPLA